MSLIQVNCANCGAPVENIGNKVQFRCSYCGALVLNIVDAELKDEVEIVTPEDLDKFLAEKKQSFIINVGDKLEEFDVDTKVINKKTSNAEEALTKRQFSIHFLDGCPDSLIVLRLKLLHTYKVCNEYELSMQSEKLQGEIYEKFISLCDETTKITYKKIEEQIEKNIASDNEIKEVQKLVGVGLWQDALIYAEQMVKKYPYKALSYVMLYARKLAAYQKEVEKIAGTLWFHDAFYIYRKELTNIITVMRNCPDYALICERYIPLVKFKKYYEDRDPLASEVQFAAEQFDEVMQEACAKPSDAARSYVYAKQKAERGELKRQAKIEKQQAKLAKKQLKEQAKLNKR